MLKLASGAALTVAFACVSLAVSPSKATTISCATNCGTGGPFSVPWSVDVASGITLDAAYYLWKDSAFAAPKKQTLGGVTAAIEGLPGLSGATPVGDGRLSSEDDAGSDSADVYALHFKAGKNSKYDEIVLVFSGSTTLSDVTAPGLRNFRSFNVALLPESFDAMVTPTILTVTPLPAALPLFATVLGGVGLLGWRWKGKAGNRLQSGLPAPITTAGLAADAPDR